MTSALQANACIPIGLRRPSLSGLTINGAQVAPTLGWIGLYLTESGKLQVQRGTGTYNPFGPFPILEQVPQWSGLTPSPSNIFYGREYQARMDILSGNGFDAVNSSTVATWFQMAGSLTWVMQGLAAPALTTAIWRISMRLRANSSVVTFADYSLDATSVPP